jgi:hypothetical protein
MFRHYIAILRERFYCLLRDAQLRSSRQNIVDGRVVSSDVVRGDLRLVHEYYFIYFIHSISMCRMRWFLAFLRTFFHSSLSYTFPSHCSPPTMLPSSLTSSCHQFLGLPLGLVASKFILNTLLGILFPSILCTCPNQHNLCTLIVSVIVGFLTIA